MWQWTDGSMELYHYGIKGMKWGVRKSRAKAAKSTKSRAKANGSTKSRKKTSQKNDILTVYKNERKRQERFLATQRAIRAGESVVNGYLARTNTTLNGKPLRVNHAAVVLVQNILNRKYAEDTF